MGVVETFIIGVLPKAAASFTKAFALAVELELLAGNLEMTSGCFHGGEPLESCHFSGLSPQ